MPDDAKIGMGLLEEALKLDPELRRRARLSGLGAGDALVRGASTPARFGGGREPCAGRACPWRRRRGGARPREPVTLHLGHDFQAAAGAVANALALNGSCVTALYFGAHIHAWSGDTAIGEDYANRALRLSPFDTYAYFAHQAKGLGCVSAGRYQDAAENFARAVHANPRNSAGLPPHTRRRWP